MAEEPNFVRIPNSNTSPGGGSSDAPVQSFPPMSWPLDHLTQQTLRRWLASPESGVTGGSFGGLAPGEIAFGNAIGAISGSESFKYSESASLARLTMGKLLSKSARIESEQHLVLDAASTYDLQLGGNALRVILEEAAQYGIQFWGRDEDVLKHNLDELTTDRIITYPDMDGTVVYLQTFLNFTQIDDSPIILNGGNNGLGGNNRGGRFVLQTADASGGGYALLQGGDSGDAGDTAGDAILQGGYGGGVGTDGMAAMADSSTLKKARFDLNALTTDRILVIQDQAGTIALLSDIPSPGTPGFLTDPQEFFGQTTNIADTGTSLTGTNLVRVSYVLLTTTADVTGGSVTLNIKFTDAAGVSRTLSSSAVSLATTGAAGTTQGSFIAQDPNGDLTYGVTHTGIFATAQYALLLQLEDLAV